MEISTDKEDQKIVTTKNFTIKTDFVLVGVGVRPNSELAQEAGIDQGIAKAIKVDSKMRTNLADIYAVGDCATARNYVTDKDSYLPLGTTANKQGRIAGRNCVENDLYSFEGIAASAITKVFDLLVGSTGLSLKDAQNEDFEAVENMIEGHTRAKYYPDGKKIWINLVADKSTHRILGAQIVGEEFVKGRIDQIALALFLKAKVEDLIHYDWCYVPPVSPVIDPLNIAASQLEKKLN
jgi:NADPH-dependent 2,4-dienoyl-CoA reductase/sulfur reductase-like enzyme